MRKSPGAEDWEFRCECSGPGCLETVSLSLAEYESVRDALLPILAEEHVQSKTAAARTRAARLRQESQALRNQARLQSARARRAFDDGGRQVRLVCSGCGYGVTVSEPPERCPMCSARAWRPEPVRRLTDGSF